MSALRIDRFQHGRTPYLIAPAVDIKYRLLVNFIVVVLLALVVFGYSAYEIADDQAMDAVQETLTNTNRLSAVALLLLHRHAPDSAAASPAEVSTGNGNQLVVLVDSSGRMIGVDESTRKRWPLAEISAQSQPSGRLVSDRQRYVWSSVALPETSYRLLYVSRAEAVVHTGLSRLSSRLWVTGLIVVWVTVWVALIMATMVSRRLSAQTAALQYQATHDSLTGLPNRILLQERLNDAIRSADNDRRSVALIMMDLDRFKEINDTLGHHVGDKLLQAIGDRLGKVLWGSDTVARLGGDEFALLLPLADSSHIIHVTNKVSAILVDPFLIEGMGLEIEASLGVAVYPDDSRTSAELISHADVAMYQAKHRGERVTHYDPNQDPHTLERLKLMADLRHAAARGELSLHYQPKIDLRNARSIGVEALIRWQHPELGMVPPDRFIVQAEQTGVIKPLSDWVLNEALRQCQAWQAIGLSLPVAVNISARVLQDPELPAQVHAALRRHGVRAELLKIEMTETAIMSDPQRAMQVLTELDAMGVGLSIDDFGTGYTSLAQLKRLPVDEVKIDRSFVMSMLRDANDAMIVHTIIDLAHNMNCSVVAEGVENRKVLDALAGLGCDEVQGYYFSRPLPANELQDWVQSTAAAEASGNLNQAV